MITINSCIMSSISIPCAYLQAVFSTFSIESVAFSAIVGKLSLFSTFVEKVSVNTVEVFSREVELN